MFDSSSIARLKKFLFDFLVIGPGYWVAYLSDAYVISKYNRNIVTLSLVAFTTYYLAARLIIKLTKKQKYFGSMFTSGPLYAFFMGVSAWVAYLIMIRWQKFGF
jgi:hypothetical protein